MITTTRIIRASIPGESSSNVGYLALVTMPTPPWEEPVSKEEAKKMAREMGGSIRTHHNTKVKT